MVIQIHTSPDLFLVTSDEDYSENYEFVEKASLQSKVQALNTPSIEEISTQPGVYRDLACLLLDGQSHIVRRAK